MSFLSTIFSGASNNYAPAGQQQNLQQAQTANANYSTANTGLNDLASVLKRQSAGGGPNIANQNLQNMTGQNVANTAALIAGQRGSSANPALAARNIATAGAGIQQNAVGQAASSELGQQLGSTQQLGQVLGTQGSLANQNYGVAQGGTNAANQIGSDEAKQNAQMNQQLIGGVTNAAGKALAFADGGSTPAPSTSLLPNFGNPNGGGFGFNFDNKPKPAADPLAGAVTMAPMAGDFSAPLHVAGGGAILPFGPSPTSAKPMGTMFLNAGGPADLTRGGNVAARSPQEKATVPGNSLKNDKIPAMVSEHEIVIPREITMAKNAPQKAAEFVARELAKKGVTPKDDFKGAIDRGIKARRKNASKDS